MACYHFALPYIWEWGPSLDALPPAIRWGSYSINFFKSYLLLMGGALTLLAWRHLGSGRTADRGIAAAMGSFWLINALYQLCSPLPIPDRLLSIRIILVGYAAATAALHLAALRGLIRLSKPV
jgi:hypothetical protein